MQPQPVFTPVERNSILKAYSKEYSFRAYSRSMTIHGRMPELQKQYMEEVPILPLSRCPFCQTINFLSIDHYDVDGLWWNTHHAPQRPHERETRCLHYYNLSGAMRLSEPIAYPPFQVETGPEVPFVMAKFLEKVPSIKVVISQIKVGPHTAYPLVYYLEGRPYIDVALHNLVPEWANYKSVFFINGEQGGFKDDTSLGYTLPRQGDSCFDLAHWIERGQLLWIEPGDESLTLRNNVQSCPYINLPGNRSVALLNRGEIYWQDR